MLSLETVPYDVAYEIAGHLRGGLAAGPAQYKDLLSFSLVSKFCHYVSQSQLVKQVDFYNRPHRRSILLLKTLLLNPGLCTKIITIRIPYTSSSVWGEELKLACPSFPKRKEFREAVLRHIEDNEFVDNWITALYQNKRRSLDDRGAYHWTLAVLLLASNVRHLILNKDNYEMFDPLVEALLGSPDAFPNLESLHRCMTFDIGNNFIELLRYPRILTRPKLKVLTLDSANINEEMDIYRARGNNKFVANTCCVRTFTLNGKIPFGEGRRPFRSFPVVFQCLRSFIYNVGYDSEGFYGGHKEFGDQWMSPLRSTLEHLAIRGTKGKGEAGHLWPFRLAQFERLKIFELTGYLLPWPSSAHPSWADFFAPTMEALVLHPGQQPSDLDMLPEILLPSWENLSVNLDKIPVQFPCMKKLSLGGLIVSDGDLFQAIKKTLASAGVQLEIRGRDILDDEVVNGWNGDAPGISFNQGTTLDKWGANGWI